MGTTKNGSGEGRRAGIFRILLGPLLQTRVGKVRHALVLPRRLLVGSSYWERGGALLPDFRASAELQLWRRSTA